MNDFLGHVMIKEIRRQWTQLRTSLVYGLGGLLCFCGSAVQADDEAYLDLSLEELLNVSITGSTLTEESLKTVPAAVSIFTHQQIARLGVDYLYELAGLVPGFQFDRNASSGVAYTYSARGRRSSQQSLEILLLIDGHAMNDARAGSPDIGIPLYPLARVERVEFIRGPGSAIYGSSAFNGVINIVTRKQQKSVGLAYGSQQRRQLDSLWSGEAGNWALDTFIHAYKDNGDEYRVPDSFSGQPIATRDPRQQVLANVTVASQETRIALSYSRIQTADFYQSDNTANGFNDNDRKFWRFAVDQDLDWFPNTRSKVILSYQQLVYDYTRHLAAPAALESVSQPASNEPFEAMVRFAGQSGHFTWSNDWTIDQNASAQWGVQFARKQETDAHLLGNFDLVQFNQQQFPINYYGEARKAFTIGLQDTQDNLGIYAQYLRNLRETTRLTLGGRYDEYPDIAGRFSPRLALVEQLSDTYSLKLLYGEAFRAPTLTEQGLTNSPVLVGNPSLTHEVVKTLDLILMGNWPTASFSIGLFQNRYQRPIETVFVFDKRTYMNGKVQRSQGVEVEWWQELSPHWSLRTSYTHMDLPDSAYREAERLASIQLNYSAAHWNWNLMGVYQDQRQNPLINGTRTTLDDFWVWNTEWRYDFSQAYTATLTIKNLTDTDYATPAQGVTAPDGVPNRGREISAGIEWRF